MKKILCIRTARAHHQRSGCLCQANDWRRLCRARCRRYSGLSWRLLRPRLLWSSSGARRRRGGGRCGSCRNRMGLEISLTTAAVTTAIMATATTASTPTAATSLGGLRLIPRYYGGYGAYAAYGSPGYYGGYGAYAADGYQGYYANRSYITGRPTLFPRYYGGCVRSDRPSERAVDLVVCPNA